MWEAIKWFRNRNFQTLSLGRTEFTNPGLLQFKQTWGGRESLIHYYRFDLGQRAFVRKGADRLALINGLLSKAPLSLLRILGSVFYKHIA
jgi:hypothetical protein